MNRTNACLLILLLACGGGAHALHLQLQNTELADTSLLAETMPSVEALQLISLGFDQLAADYYWLRSISNFGDGRLHKYNYPNLVALLQRVTSLDPYFASAYIFVGSALTLNGMDWRAPAKILEQGMRMRPDNWNIAFQAGFIDYYFLNDYPRAVTALVKAARLPGAPDFVGPLATRLAAQAGEPEVGLQFVDAILASVHDPVLIATYVQRHNLLMLEIMLRDLRQAAGSFKKKHGAAPESLAALVQDHDIDGIPDDPLGGAFYLDSQGMVQTKHESERLRLPAAAQVHLNANASD